jgi:hypothetical protein
MKKFTIIVAMFFTATLAFSQTPLTQAVDFTATDVTGVERNLFELLDGGQYVCIDFFFTS